MTTKPDQWAHEGSEPHRFEGEYDSAEAAALAGFAWHDPPARGDIQRGTPYTRRYIRVAEIARFRAEDFAPDGEALCEWMFERACDRTDSDMVDNWPDATAAMRRELGDAIEAVVKAWADKHDLHPKFWGIHDDAVRVYEATARNDAGDVTEVRAVPASRHVHLEQQGKI